MVSPVLVYHATFRPNSASNPAQFPRAGSERVITLSAALSENTTFATMIAYTRREHPVGR